GSSLCIHVVPRRQRLGPSLTVRLRLFDHKTAYPRPRTRTTTRTRTIREAGGSKLESHPVKSSIHIQFTYGFKEMLGRVLAMPTRLIDRFDTDDTRNFSSSSACVS